jgi:large subunit ribosomal protein L22
MISKASAMFVRISPRKVRYVIDQIRKKSVMQAQGILSGSPRRAGEIIRKLLDQAVDAATKNSKVPAKDLVVSSVMADGGPMMKRFRAASMGRASQIKKRTSHIYLELDVKNPSLLPVKPAAVKDARVKKSTPVSEAPKKSAPSKKPAKKLVGAK